MNPSDLSMEHSDNCEKVESDVRQINSLEVMESLDKLSASSRKEMVTWNWVIMGKFKLFQRYNIGRVIAKDRFFRITSIQFLSNVY